MESEEEPSICKNLPSSGGRKPSFSPNLLETLKKEKKIEATRTVGEPEKRLLWIVDTVRKKPEVKSKLPDLSIADPSENLTAKIQMTSPTELGEIKANFFSKNEKVLMSQFTASRAIAIMGSSRRKRRELGEVCIEIQNYTIVSLSDITLF